MINIILPLSSADPPMTITLAWALSPIMDLIVRKSEGEAQHPNQPQSLVNGTTQSIHRLIVSPIFAVHSLFTIPKMKKKKSIWNRPPSLQYKFSPSPQNLPSFPPPCVINPFVVLFFFRRSSVFKETRSSSCVAWLLCPSYFFHTSSVLNLARSE